MSKAEILERERRWARPVAILAILAVALFAASRIVLASNFGGDGDAELLREVDDNPGIFLLGYVLRVLGSALLSVPLVYLFRAAEARSDRVRGQLIGLIIAGPLFLAAFSLTDAFAIRDAASDFVGIPDPGTGERADDVAQNALEEASLRGLAIGFGFAGALGFAIALTYTCYQAMQAGLLTRFWGSLGAALGIGSFLFFEFTLLWIAYLGLLIGGWTPRARPPAWEAGEAVPWPTPGERAAESLEAEEEEESLASGEESEAADEPLTAPEPASAPGEGEGQGAAPRRKRKRRS